MRFLAPIFLALAILTAVLFAQGGPPSTNLWKANSDGSISPRGSKALTLPTALAVAQGGTGATTATAARAALGTLGLIYPFFPAAPMTFAASSTYYIGSGVAISTVQTNSQSAMLAACTVRAVEYSSRCGANPSGGTCCSVTVDLVTASGAQVANSASAQNWTNVGSGAVSAVVTGLSQAVTTTDVLSVRVATPAWSSAPTTCATTARVYCADR